MIIGCMTAALYNSRSRFSRGQIVHRSKTRHHHCKGGKFPAPQFCNIRAVPKVSKKPKVITKRRADQHQQQCARNTPEKGGM